MDSRRARPTGPIIDLVGLKITAAGKPVTWSRDAREYVRVSRTVPDGASALERDVRFHHPAGSRRIYIGRICDY